MPGDDTLGDDAKGPREGAAQLSGGRARDAPAPHRANAQGAPPQDDRPPVVQAEEERVDKGQGEAFAGGTTPGDEQEADPGARDRFGPARLDGTRR